MLIRGGLGNQMFQVAHAVVLAKYYSVEAEFIDTTRMAFKGRAWELGCFEIVPAQLNPLKKYLFILSIFLKRFCSKYKLPFLNNVLVEDGGKFDMPSSPPSLVYGYWQKHSIYESYQNEISRLFKFPSSSFLKQFNSDSSLVAIHVRRGDYVEDEKSKNIHLVCDVNWYRSAWNKMQSKIIKPQAIVFSDDLEWAKRELNLSGNVVFNDTDLSAPAWVDMANMSQCDHFIISNSSYSWWAAWLGKKKDKVVIAPSEWFRGKFTKDLGVCPDEWILL